jgi:hypothetical protein
LFKYLCTYFDTHVLPAVFSFPADYKVGMPTLQKKALCIDPLHILHK